MAATLISCASRKMLSSVCLLQGFGFENGRRVINRSPWVGKGSCRRVKNHSLSVFQESYSDYHKMNLNVPWNLLVLQIICTGNMYKVIDVFWLLFL